MQSAMRAAAKGGLASVHVSKINMRTNVLTAGSLSFVRKGVGY